jgi:hypothetical protein
MSNDSTVAGYLTPVDTTEKPLEDAALTAVFQTMVSGVTGLAGAMVRPRWQSVPANMPSQQTDWCAIGITKSDPDPWGVVVHYPQDADADPDSGYDQLQQHEVLCILCTFYGPNSSGNASLLRGGLQIAQNREQLQLGGFGLKSVGPAVQVAEQINNLWVPRVDVELEVKYELVRTYQVRNIKSSGGTIKTDSEDPLVERTFNVTTNN